MNAAPPPENYTAEADAAFRRFVALCRQRQQHTHARDRYARHLAEQKSQMLIPVRQTLQRLVEAGLVVPGWDTKRDPRPVSFEVFEDEASPSWRPGTSLQFRNPVPVEIAVVNPIDRAAHGVFAVTLGAPHPDQGILARRFDDSEALCVALAEFLGRNAIAAKRLPDD